MTIIWITATADTTIYMRTEPSAVQTNYERTAIFAVRSIFVLTSGYIVRILYISDMNSRDRGESLNLIISNAGDRPIYEQIYTQIKDCIISGELSEGDMLPSIRALAKDLRISVITTKRAYQDLEAQGYVTTVPGKGCYVAEQNLDLLREERLRRVEASLARAVCDARACGLSDDELREMLDIQLEEK